jgi:tRNA(Arg) A34 adenosine deaminase TadA
MKRREWLNKEQNLSAQLATSHACMQTAIEEAQKGRAEGGIPIGSVLVYQGKIIGQGHNRRIQQGNPILHAEMDALANAKRQPAHIYQNCTLYTTLSPCALSVKTKPLSAKSYYYKTEA